MTMSEPGRFTRQVAEQVPGQMGNPRQRPQTQVEGNVSDEHKEAMRRAKDRAQYGAQSESAEPDDDSVQREIERILRTHELSARPATKKAAAVLRAAVEAYGDSPSA